VEVVAFDDDKRIAPDRASTARYDRERQRNARRQGMFEVEGFVADCRAALKETLPQLAIKELIERALSRPDEVERALGEPREAGINTLHRSAELTILNIIWAPGMYLYPHDHRMWAAIGLYGGREDNFFFRRTTGGLQTAGGRNLETRDTMLLGKDAIHTVANPLTKFTGGLHVYGGDFFGVARSEWDPQTLEERPFDVERAKRVFQDANERVRSASNRPA
jgi:predicted metal-dependent enzyme (double-stranded beta helix superfamily)